MVRKQLDKAIQKINNKLKNNKIPFYNDMMDEEYAMRSLSRVSSEAIYKSLKEVDVYLDKKEYKNKYNDRNKY